MELVRMERKFLVIATTVTVNRTLCHDEHAATAHARGLIEQQRQAPGTELWVVEIKRVVRVLSPTPPVEVVEVE